jgi:hypothetical protein
MELVEIYLLDCWPGDFGVVVSENIHKHRLRWIWLLNNLKIIHQ